jgi:RNA polymerase sigma-70 factor (ECF subfamily)
VLHDLFAVPFADIAPILDRSPVATKKLASRARHRVRGTTDAPRPEVAGHREVVAAFLAAARGGDLTTLLAVLTPEVVRRADPVVLPAGASPELRGASEVAAEIQLLGGRAKYAEPALVNGAVGAVVAPGGHLRLAITFTFEDDRIAGFEVIADPSRLRGLTLATLPDHDAEVTR